MAEAATEEPKQEAEETTQEEQAQEDAVQEASAEEEQEQEERELLTLSEVSERTGISMPTLQRYKKNYQDRLPTVGKGRTQKYPIESLPVFQQIKKENIKKRGRPRKKGKKKKGKKPAPARKDLLTLTEIGERTGISYPTLVRYAKLYLDRIPHEGEGRRRRYYPEAVEVFQQIRGESRRGRKKSTGKGKGTSTADKSLARRVQALERSHKALEKQIRTLIQDLRKPMTVTVQRNR